MLDLRTPALRPIIKLPRFGARRSPAALDAIDAIRTLPRASVSGTVPWDWPDLGRIMAWTTALAAAISAVTWILLTLAKIFVLGLARTGVTSSTAASGVSDTLGRYQTPAVLIACVASFYLCLGITVVRDSIHRAGAVPAALGIRSLKPRTIGRICALFVPVTLLGTVVTACQSALSLSPSSAASPDFVTPSMLGSTPAVALTGLLFVLIVPCVEELFFRGFLLGLLRNRMPVWAAIGGSACAYAASHGSLALFPWLLVMGIGYGVVTSKTGSLFAGLMLHVMTNAVGLIGILAVARGW